VAKRDRGAALVLAAMWEEIATAIARAAEGDPAGRSQSLDDLAAYRQMLVNESIEPWSGLLMTPDAARHLAGHIDPGASTKIRVIAGNVQARLRALLGQ
jgi:hypothetical protein